MLEIILKLAQLALFDARTFPEFLVGGAISIWSEASEVARSAAIRTTAGVRWHSPAPEGVCGRSPKSLSTFDLNAAFGLKAHLFSLYRQNARVSEGILHTTHDKGIKHRLFVGNKLLVM